MSVDSFDSSRVSADTELASGDERCTVDVAEVVSLVLVYSETIWDVDVAAVCMSSGCGWCAAAVGYSDMAFAAGNSFSCWAGDSTHGCGSRDTKGGAVATSVVVVVPDSLCYDAMRTPHDYEEADVEVNGSVCSVCIWFDSSVVDPVAPTELIGVCAEGGR